ncbi:MAG TPA: hypothetical protein VJV75_12160, partial [Candidatus Polarisedimenticolia bacterium]|nr:hypothetical protein [Candidatus Polarisedimenticolia bacterium]
MRARRSRKARLAQNPVQPPLDRRAAARRFGRRVVDLGLRLNADRRRVWSGVRASDLTRRFAGPIPEQGEPAARLLRAFERDIAAHSMPMAHPRLFGLFTPAPLPVAAFAELLAAFLNQAPDAWKAGPAATHVEARLVRWFTGRIGWGRDAFGAFTSG